MDMKKFGAFLRALRKEKRQTQEQLAEYLNVSGRTVSRWETGNNLPDLDILVILSDYYEVDIRELIDGERKSEKLNKEQKESIKKVADYSSLKERFLIRKTILVVVMGIAAWCITLILSLIFMNEVTGGVMTIIATLIGFILYNLCMWPRKSNRTPNGFLLSLIGAFSAVVASNLLMLIVFFGSGTYHNFGIIGAWYAVGIYVATFLVSGVVVSCINKKKTQKKNATGIHIETMNT